MKPGPIGGQSAQKVYYSGTHRTRHPDATWELLIPKLARFGITRVADVTGLDTLGVPTVMAVRPLAATLAVSQGKGFTLRLAQVSAAMESMELWHAENVRPPVHQAIPAHALRLPYQFESLTTAGSLINPSTPIDWLDAFGLRSGTPILVPEDLVLCPQPSDPLWRPFGFTWSSNGLASGNGWPEACLHALYEVLERDAISSPDRGDLLPLDPASVDDPGCAALIERIEAAGATLEIGLLRSRFGIPCFGARIWSPDFPVVARGWGAHGDAGVALSRAITEAAQSRLTAIVGSRDDLPSLYSLVQIGSGPAFSPQAPRCDWAETVKGMTPAFTDLAHELEWLCARVEDVLGMEPVAVDLGTDEEFAVVKIVVPGACFDADLVHSSH